MEATRCSHFGSLRVCPYQSLRAEEATKRMLGTDETSVEGAGENGVGGALDQGSAVGEDGDRLFAAAKAKQQGVGAEVVDLGLASERGLERGKIERALMLVDLDGVASAECDVRARGAGEVVEAALGTDAAVGIGRRRGDFRALVGPEIAGEESAAEEPGLAGKQLEGLGDLERGGEVDGRGEDAGGVAGFDGSGGRGREEAGEAGGGLVVLRRLGSNGQDGHGGGIGPEGGGVDPGFALFDGEVVEQVAGFEVVGAVEQQVGAGEQGVDVGGDEVRDHWLDVNGGVEGGDLAAGGFGLGQGFAGVGFIE